MTWSPARRPRRFRPGPLAAVTATVLAAGALTVLSPVAAAAPCDPWPPTATGGGTGGGAGSSGSGGSPSTPATPSTPAAPWANGASGYIPILTGRTTTVELLTGPTSPNNTVEEFGITGTDLGILWDNGDTTERQVLMALGDTMGDCEGDAQWRSNILFRSNDRTLSDGMRILNAPMEPGNTGLAKSILPRANQQGETTVIPTAGVSVGPTAGVSVEPTQYLRYMSVAAWGDPGEWTTNYSALAKSTDNGENWEPISGTARQGTGSMNTPLNVGAPFTTHTAGQMSAFLKHSDGNVDYVYEYMTPSGRNGSAILARVPEAQIESMGAYKFWNGAGWVADQTEASVVLDGQVSELSVSWSPRFDRFIALYTDQNNNVVMRQALTPEGLWSGKDILLSSQHVPTLYGAFAHPWSPAIEFSGEDLYFTLSTWDAYNVFLMKTDLTDLTSLAQRNPPNSMARTQTADDSWTRDTADPADTGETVLVERRPIPEA